MPVIGPRTHKTALMFGVVVGASVSLVVALIIVLM